MGEILTNTSAVHEDTATSKSSIGALGAWNTMAPGIWLPDWWQTNSFATLYMALPSILGRSHSTDSLKTINPYKSCMKQSVCRYDSDADGLSSSDGEAEDNGTMTNERSNSVRARPRVSWCDKGTVLKFVCDGNLSRGSTRASMEFDRNVAREYHATTSDDQRKEIRQVAMLARPFTGRTRWIADTGSGNHLIGLNNLSGEERKSLRDSDVKLRLRTANGVIVADKCIDLVMDVLGQTISPIVLPNTPAVLSVGILCEDEGARFDWRPGKPPIMILKDGRIVKFYLENRVPYFRRRWIFRRRENSFSTMAMQLMTN